MRLVPLSRGQCPFSSRASSGRSVGNDVLDTSSSDMCGPRAARGSLGGLALSAKFAFFMENDPKKAPKTTYFVLKILKMTPKSYPAVVLETSRCRPFSRIQCSMTFWSHFGPLWLHFGSILAPIGRLWAVFWMILASFRIHIVHFGANLHICCRFSANVCIDFRKIVFQNNIWPQTPQPHKPTNQPTTNQQRKQSGPAECALAL